MSKLWDKEIIWILLFFVAPVLFAIGHSIYTDNKVTCHGSTTLYKEITKEDPSLTYSQSYFESKGVNGDSTVCERGNGTEYSRTVHQEVINEVWVSGTKETPVILTPLRQSTGGAICADGTRSYSSGRGTCSWHGGVAEWL